MSCEYGRSVGEECLKGHLLVGYDVDFVVCEYGNVVVITQLSNGNEIMGGKFVEGVCFCCCFREVKW